MSQLEPKIWDFSEFVKTNAWKWVGDSEEVEKNEYYGEVDKRRDMGGVIVRKEIAGQEGEQGKETKVAVHVEAKAS